MEFAWEKVIDHRGISASRSVEKIKAWLWLLEDYELYVFAGIDANYPKYGAPILRVIAEKYGFDIPKGWPVDLMSEGKPCGYDCWGCNN